ncbi:sigma 54-interacting transcriptional regulator [Photobacterium alginatilyticum]|uniref:Sigma-54-dependent Fis family transcriptional regulator n=1 Tax=Photobacterium alginatilyticum TaxID=1775171 RepID=A0ABW9YM09_9GAMM|nr:sigma-54-dependent Fis family transcriptional regulator [Photobacterium alginatilyticum]
MSQKPTLLIIDDEVNLTRSLKIALKSQDYEIAIAHDAAEGLAVAHALRPFMILLDLRLPDSDDLQPLSRLCTLLADSKIVMMSAHGDISTAVEAVKMGASDFVTKPFDVAQLRQSVSQCLAEVQVTSHCNGLIGQSPVMEKLARELTLIANSHTRTILLLGESGTGKTAAASELHRQSQLGDKPFIEVNCAALPEALLEAELFGAEKGAYTGAHRSRGGLIEAADGGTLFLDEVGELTLPTQAKLLSFLENQRYRPVGSATEKQADVRIIAATNLHLRNAMEEGRFRSDLFYRLNVMPVHIPSLSERREDIPLLMVYFADRFRFSGKALSFAETVTEAFCQYAWPGNIRELRNFIERLSVLYPGQVIITEMLPPDWQIVRDETSSLQEASTAPNTSIQSQTDVTSSVQLASDAVAASNSVVSHLANEEKKMILHALHETGGHKGNAAKLLQISRHALKRRLQKLGIQS